MSTIVHTPDPVLLKTASPVAKIDKKILSVITGMKAALIGADDPKGVGLAAPQIGISLRIFLLRPFEKDPIRVCVNPEIVWKSEQLVRGIPGSESKLEGCLSLPKVWGIVTRFASVKLKYMDEQGREYTVAFTGFPAVIVQHEIDHLDGILFTKRVVEQKNTLYKATYDDRGKEILQPLQL